jgi:hypothetical protein
MKKMNVAGKKGGGMHLASVADAHKSVGGGCDV